MLAYRSLIVALLLVFATRIAQAANFPGWVRNYTAIDVTLVSPADQQGQVSLSIGVAEFEGGDPQTAFRKAVDEAVGSLGADIKLVGRSGVRVENGVLIDTLRVRLDNGGEIDILAFSYHTGGKIYQSGMLGYISTMPDTDRRVNQALDFIATAVRTRYRLTDPRAFDRTAPSAQQVTAYNNSQSAPPPPPAAPSTPVPQQSGKRCERRAIWGFRVSYWCQPSGICNDRVIKGYETVCE